MVEKASFFLVFVKTYSTTVLAIRKNPRIFLPFLIFAVFDAMALLFFYFAPREPLRAVMGPLITTFWGERFLHYPQNFLLLPQLAGLFRMVLSVLLGSMLTGVAVSLLYNKPLSTVFKKYIGLFFIILSLVVTYYALDKGISIFFAKYFNAGHQKFLFIGPRWWLGSFKIVMSQCLAIFLQAAFAYAIPILLTTEKKFFTAIAGSFVFFIRNFVITLMLVAVPTLVVVPLMVLNYNSLYLMGAFFPEIILFLGFLGIVVNSLILDPLINLTAANLYLEKKEGK